MQSSTSSLDVVEENDIKSKSTNSLAAIVKEKDSGSLSDCGSPHKNLNSPKTMREM